MLLSLCRCTIKSKYNINNNNNNNNNSNNNNNILLFQHVLLVRCHCKCLEYIGGKHPHLMAITLAELSRVMFTKN